MEIQGYNNINQAANFQHKCQNCLTLWIRNLANFEDHPKQSPNIYQQVPLKNTKYEIRKSLGENGQESAKRTKEVLTWNPSGKRRRGRPRHTWRRKIEPEMAAEGYSLKQLEKLAQNRIRWKLVIDGPCSATG